MRCEVRLPYFFARRGERCLVLRRTDGEPDLYLITRYADFVTVAEGERRDKIIEARMKMDAHALDKASGGRVKMRRQMGGLLLRELNPR